MRFIKQFAFVLLLFAIVSHFSIAAFYVHNIEQLGNGKYLIHVSDQAQYNVFELPNPQRLVIDLKDTVSRRPVSLNVQEGMITRVRCAQHSTNPENIARVVFDMESSVPYDIKQHKKGILVSFPSLLPQSPGPVSVVDRYADIELSDSRVELPPIRLAQQISPASPPPVDLQGPTVVADGITYRGFGNYTGDPITIDFKDVEVVDVLTFLAADVGGRNIVVHPDVRGTVTLRIINTPWDAVFDLILRNSDLGMEEHDNIIRVATIRKLTTEKQEQAALSEQKALAAPLVTELVQLNYAKAQEVASIFQNFQSRKEGAEILTDERTNIIVIRDIPEYIDQMMQLIDKLDREVPQVVIEARIVETSSDITKMFGVGFGANVVRPGPLGTGTGYDFPYSYNSTFRTGLVDSGILTGSMSNFSGSFNVHATIDAIERIGRGRQVSTPKVIVQNNSMGMIRHGQDITRLSERTDQDGNIVTSTTTVSAYTQINVRPTITPDNNIILDIAVDKDNIIGFTVDESTIDRNNVRSTIVVGDGETIVIGGLFQITEGHSEDKIPFFGDIPVIRHLFRRQGTSQRSSELLIFITPTIRENY